MGKALRIGKSTTFFVVLPNSKFLKQAMKNHHEKFMENAISHCSSPWKIQDPEALDIIIPLEHSVVAPAMAALGSAGVLDGDDDRRGDDVSEMVSQTDPWLVVNNPWLTTINHHLPLLTITNIWLVVWNMTFIFPIILGMASSQLTFIFFRGVETTNQI